MCRSRTYAATSAALHTVLAVPPILAGAWLVSFVPARPAVATVVTMAALSTPAVMLRREARRRQPQRSTAVPAIEPARVTLAIERARPELPAVAVLQVTKVIEGEVIDR